MTAPSGFPVGSSQHGSLGWLLQRVSGLFLAYAMVVHLWAVHVVDMDRLSWDTISARLQDGTAWTVYYGLFVPAVVFHACNGLWTIILDYNPPPVLRRALGGMLWLGGFGLLIYGYFALQPLLGRG